MSRYEDPSVITLFWVAPCENSNTFILFKKKKNINSSNFRADSRYTASFFYLFIIFLKMIYCFLINEEKRKPKNKRGRNQKIKTL